MELVQSIINFLKKKNTSKAPEGICPNCWGRDEYAGQFYERIKQENLDVNSADTNVGWISAYANKHFASIALKRSGNSEGLICEKCKVSFQQKQQ